MMKSFKILYDDIYQFKNDDTYICHLTLKVYKSGQWLILIKEFGQVFMIIS